MVVVPWVVLEELDGLKERNKGQKLGQAAQRAVRILKDLVERKIVCGQTILGDTQAGRFLRESADPRKPDDKVLVCCLQCLEGKLAQKAVLLTEDLNLMAKAAVHGIEAHGWESFCRNVLRGADSRKLLELDAMDVDEPKPVHPPPPSNFLLPTAFPVAVARSASSSSSSSRMAQVPPGSTGIKHSLPKKLDARAARMEVDAKARAPPSVPKRAAVSSAGATKTSRKKDPKKPPLPAEPVPKVIKRVPPVPKAASSDEMRVVAAALDGQTLVQLRKSAVDLLATLSGPGNPLDEAFAVYFKEELGSTWEQTVSGRGVRRPIDVLEACRTIGRSWAFFSGRPELRPLQPLASTLSTIALKLRHDSHSAASLVTSDDCHEFFLSVVKLSKILKLPPIPHAVMRSLTGPPTTH